MAKIPRESKTMKARRAMVNRVTEIPTRDWVLLPNYTDMALFMNELVNGLFDPYGGNGDGAPDMIMSKLYWSPSVNLKYACDDEQDPVIAYFGRDKSSRGPHDVVAVRECNSRWVGQLVIKDFGVQELDKWHPEGIRRFQVFNLAGDHVFQVWIQYQMVFHARDLAKMVTKHLMGASYNVNAGTKIVFVFDENILDIDADLQELPVSDSLNSQQPESNPDSFFPNFLQSTSSV